MKQNYFYGKYKNINWNISASDLSLATTHASLKSIVSVTTSIDPDDPRERKSSLYNPG